MESDGFTIVKSKKSNKKGIKQIEKRTTVIHDTENIEIDRNKVIDRIKNAKIELEQSDYYKQVIKDVNNNVNDEEISELYCFGLGHFSDSVTAKFQLCLLLSIAEALNISKSNIFLSDPAFYKVEIEMLKEDFSLNVIEENLECFLECDKKTLIFLPHCPKQMTNNLLFSNWNPSTLPNVILISNSLSNTANGLHKNISFIQDVVEAKIVQETCLENTFKFQDIFNDLSLHCFKVSENRNDGFWNKPNPSYDVEDLEFIAVTTQ